ncbi:hypothetical protein JMUB3934_0737 [Leptotrichia wadei]|uniref:Uncharacterized protein n=1 Tax=Leptotrichia wadei TaxID=157687 RepID=A0A510KCN8_9FUSO|nr:hypothetical protein JMUB3934_0737 [Leptotrichia wadei]
MVIYGLAIICGIFLFCRYRNNFYLYKYLVIYFNFYEILKKILEKFSKIWNKIIINKEKIIIGIIFISIIYIFGYGLKKNIENNTLVNISNYNIIEKSKNIFENIIKLIMLIIIFIVYCGVFYVLDELIYEIWEKLLKKNLLEIIFLILLLFCGINTLNWFQKFNYVLSNLFLEFLFLFCIICILKIIILNISKKEKIILIVCFLVCFFGIILGSNTEINSEVGIRLTKGKLRDLNGKRIRLFFENEKITFQIQNDKNKYYIKYQLPEEEKKYTKDIKETKILFNKDNNLSLFINKEILSKKAKFIVFNNDNSQIIDKDGKIIDNAEVAIKVVTFENTDNTNTIYIFVNNGWWLLNNKDKIYIEEDNIYLNLINLILFLFSVLYFWLKLYGKKSSEYYNKEIINKIKNTSILLDRNKYDKFLTLSMFGLTIPNIWKIVTMKSIGEMNSSIWLQADLIVYVVLFSIILFCLITSKEISECVKELENEKEGYIEYYI